MGKSSLMPSLQLRYTDPSRQRLQRLEIALAGALLLLLGLLGPPALAEAQAIQRATEALQRADRLAHQGHQREALLELERSLQAWPELFEAWDLLATLHYERGDRPAAIRAYQRGLEALPQEPDLHFHLSRMLYLEGRYQESLTHAERALALAPGEPHLLHQVERCRLRAAGAAP